jgi:hypothetical protein
MITFDPLSLEVLFGAMVSVEDRLQTVAQGHRNTLIQRLEDHYQHDVDLGAEPYVPFLVSTYALQFYKTLNRMGKIGKKQPKKRKRRGKKAVGFAFPEAGGYFCVKAFDPDKDLAPQVQRRIALEQARMEERFKQGLDGYRQETLGIEQYIWRTMDDGKVRALHRQYDDRTFSWDNPPADGHPGDAFGCRCTADPVLPERLPFEPAPPEISDEDWAALAQEVALTLALTVLAAYTGGAATPLVLARAARLASRMRGAYQAAARFIRTIKDPTAREGFKRRQESLEKAIKRVDDAVKRGEEKWKFGRHKSHQKWENQMQKRGWTPKQVDEAIQNGKQYPAPNRVNPKNPAIRYEHPETGRIVVRDETTKEIIQIGGSLKEGFKPSEIDDIFLRQENP